MHVMSVRVEGLLQRTCALELSTMASGRSAMMMSVEQSKIVREWELHRGYNCTKVRPNADL